MKSEFIVQMAPSFDAEEKNALSDYMDTGAYLTEFEQTKKFEAALKQVLNCKHVFAVNNGTIALTVAALACDLRPNDEVIVPNYTMVATPNSVRLFGARVKFVDVEPDTLCLDLERVKHAITKRTRAIIFVSANGRYPNYDIGELRALADHYGLHLIEDAAQALGSFYPDGRHIGLAGHVGTLSFSAPKIISTGQGGAVFTNSDDIAYKISRLKDFGRAVGGIDIHDTIGYNFKFTDMQAVVGLVQLKKLTNRLIRKKEIYSIYQSRLGQYMDGGYLIKNDTNFTAPWFYELICEQRDELKRYLKDQGIGTRDMYPPINRQYAYQYQGSFPVSEFIGANGVWLPSQVQLSDAQVNFICDKVLNFLKI